MLPNLISKEPGKGLLRSVSTFNTNMGMSSYLPFHYEMRGIYGFPEDLKDGLKNIKSPELHG